MALRAQQTKPQKMDYTETAIFDSGLFGDVEGWEALLLDNQDSFTQPFNQGLTEAYPLGDVELDMFFNSSQQIIMVESLPNFSCDATPISQEVVIYDGPPSFVSSDENEELYGSSSGQSPQDPMQVDNFNLSTSWFNDSSQKENAFFSFGGESDPAVSFHDSTVFSSDLPQNTFLDDLTLENIKAFLMSYADQQFSEGKQEGFMMPPPLFVDDNSGQTLTDLVKEKSPSVSPSAKKSVAVVASAESKKKKASIAKSSSMVTKKRSPRKISEKKRGQNKNAAARYRSKKRVQEEIAMEEHHRLLTELEELKSVQIDLRKNIAYAVRLAEEKLKKLMK
jgi:hypothetical protein